MSILRASNIKPPPGSRIDPTHQLGDGVGYLLGNDGSGKQYTDAGPYRHHGTLTNMDPATDWVAERYGYALDFAGDNDYVELGKNKVWEENTEGTVVVSFKLNATLAADGLGALFGYGGDAGISSFLDFAVRSHPDWSQTTRIDITTVIAGGATGVAGSTDLSADVRYQAIFTGDGSNYVLYLNGVQETPTVWSGSPDGTWYAGISPAQNRSTSIGALKYIGIRQAYLNAKIEYAYVYPRVLTADEVAWLYHESYCMVISPDPARFLSVPVVGYVPYPHKSGLGGGIGQIRGGKAA